MTAKRQEGPAGAVGVIPTLGVPDLDEAAAFYTRLGFRREWAYPSTGEATTLGMLFGDVTLMLMRLEPDCPLERQNLYLIVRDIDSYRAWLEKRSGLEVPAPVDADYRMRDFSITDPWGHLLTFGQEA